MDKRLDWESYLYALFLHRYIYIGSVLGEYVRYDCIACREDQLTCNNTGRCISAADYFCDGRDDCGDSSDEPKNCSE